MKGMKKARKLRRSALRKEKRREYAVEMARLSPAERLRVGLEFSDFCLMLAAAGQKARAQGPAPESRLGA